MAHDAAPIDAASDTGPDSYQQDIQACLERYWVTNVRLMATLTVGWLLVGLGCGVLFADALNRLTLPGTGYPLGFWFAQQGSILGFVLIILTYCTLMNRLDAKHHAELQDLRRKQRGEPWKHHAELEDLRRKQRGEP